MPTTLERFVGQVCMWREMLVKKLNIRVILEN